MPATKETYWASQGEAYHNEHPLLPVSAADKNLGLGRCSTSLRVSHTELIYLSGKTFDPKDIINGEPADEPLIVAHQSIMEDVHACVTTKVQIGDQKD